DLPDQIDPFAGVTARDHRFVLVALLRGEALLDRLALQDPEAAVEPAGTAGRRPGRGLAAAELLEGVERGGMDEARVPPVDGVLRLEFPVALIGVMVRAG